MSTKTETELIDSAGGARSEPGGRAQRPAGAAPPVGLPDEVRDRLADEVIDELLAGARSEEEIVGPGGVLAQLTRRRQRQHPQRRPQVGTRCSVEPASRSCTGRAASPRRPAGA